MSLCLCTCLGTPFGFFSGACIGTRLIKLQVPSREVLLVGLTFVLIGVACYVPVRLDCRGDGPWTLWLNEPDCMELLEYSNTLFDVLASMAGVSLGWGICLMIAACSLYWQQMPDDDTTVVSNEEPALDSPVPVLEMETFVEREKDEELGKDLTERSNEE